jgi:Flp pilus assembly protein TadG
MRLKEQRWRCRGSSLVEFTLVGIPVIFILISVFEISRGMWLYQTLAHSVKEAARFSVVHGANCEGPDHSCLKTVGDVAQVIKDTGVGLEPSLLEVTLGRSCGQAQLTCTTAYTGTLQDLLSGTQSLSQWPPAGANERTFTIEVAAIYPFRSMIAMFWPGAGAGTNFTEARLGASSREKIQF